MPKANKNAEAFLKLIFWNAVVAADSGPGPDVYDNFGAGTAILKAITAGNLYMTLHTADPGVAGAQNTSEFGYTGYARIAVPRTSSDWTYALTAGVGAQMKNTNALTFGKMTAGTGGTALYWGIGTDSSGAGNLLWYGPLALEVAKPFVVIDTSADDLLIPGHGYAVDDLVALIDVSGAALPGATAEGTYYYVANASGGSDANKIRLSTTPAGGAIVNISGVGSGYIAKSLSKPITNGDEPKVDALAAVVTER